MAELVNVDNFARAESDRMFGAIAHRTGGVNRWHHDRQFAPLDEQTVIRMNRDTFYSTMIADISGGAVLTLPDAGDRYMSAMIVNQDHFINHVLHEPGDHELTVADYDTPYVFVAIRTLVDPNDPADVEAVHVLQDQLGFAAQAASPFVMPEYDEASFDSTRTALLELAKGLAGLDHAFGRRQDVQPVRHLIGAAAGWGGLPETEAFYVNVNPGLPVGHYQLTVGDVPVDAFWSISVYNAAGYYEPNSANSYTLNNITAEPNPDGTITVNFGSDAALPNSLPIAEGWNYVVRLYLPRPSILDGSWQFPSLTPA